MRQKTEEIRNSIIVPLTASPTLRINKKIEFEKWDFDHIFDKTLFYLKVTMFEKKKDREKIEKTCWTMRQKDRGDLKLHYSAINRFANSQNHQENRLWKMRFWSYFRWSTGFWKTHYVRRKKTIEKKSRKHAKLWTKKTEEILNSILVPLITPLTRRSNKKIDFENWDF